MSYPDPAPYMWKIVEDPITHVKSVEPVEYSLAVRQASEPSPPRRFDSANDPEMERAVTAGLRHS